MKRALTYITLSILTLLSAGCGAVNEAIAPTVTAADGRPCPKAITPPEVRTAEIYRGDKTNDPASLRMSATLTGEVLRCKYDNDFLEADVKVTLFATSGPSLADIQTAEVPFPYFMIVKDSAKQGGRVRAKGVYFLKAVAKNGADPQDVAGEKTIRLPLYALGNAEALTPEDMPEILVGFEGNIKRPKAQ